MIVFDEQNKLKDAIVAWKKAVEYSPGEHVYLYFLAKDAQIEVKLLVIIIIYDVYGYLKF